MTAATLQRTDFARRALRACRPKRARFRDREFWIVQVLMVAATAILYPSHMVTEEGLAGGLHDIPVMFYLAPLLYATVTYGFEGAVLTSGWTLLLAVPHAFIYSMNDYEWLGDLGSLTIIVVTSLALAIGVERERDERERAEAASERLTLLNEVGRALGASRSVPTLLQDLVRELRQGLHLGDAAAVSVIPTNPGEAAAVWIDPDLGETRTKSVVADLTRIAQTGTATSMVDGWLIAPMIAGDRPLGAIAAERDGEPFSSQEREVFQTAAQQAAVALDRLKFDLEHRQRLASYARQVTNAQEEEQRRIARELHDGVVQDLSGLCRGLDLFRAELLAERSTPDATAAALRSLAEESLQDLRRVTRDLRPTILDDLGLGPSVEWLAADLRARAGVVVRFQTDGPMPELSPEQELTAFRIAQEAFRNVEKHAGATSVEASLIARDGALQMRIADDGSGFVVPADANELASRGAYGVLGMQERAALSGGSLAVESSPSRGTVVSLTIAPEGAPRPAAGRTGLQLA